MTTALQRHPSLARHTVRFVSEVHLRVVAVLRQLKSVANRMSKAHSIAPLASPHAVSYVTQTRVARVRAEYPNQLDYSGC